MSGRKELMETDKEGVSESSFMRLYFSQPTANAFGTDSTHILGSLSRIGLNISQFRNLTSPSCPNIYSQFTQDLNVFVILNSDEL